jgi:hypothetical protein
LDHAAGSYSGCHSTFGASYGYSSFNVAIGYYAGDKLTGECNVVAGRGSACNVCSIDSIIIGSDAAVNNSHWLS